MAEDKESIDLERRLGNVEEAVNDDAAEIKQLKREIAGLKENVKDVLRILGVVYGQPYVQPRMSMLPEQTKGYDEALARLRAQYVDSRERPSPHSR
ncbi:MAG: hypothetical protein JO025_22000 [Verrucomicrobia bacterium]|jgi:CII-binding regulator of phage lambda lysogenization HflD|nr:hypothetical protein [Verrucomicrobiota bacterium]